MTPERFKELQFGSDPQKLTSEEMKNGYMFCLCEWDVMLMKRTDPEAKFCTCLQTEIKENKK